MYLVSRYENLLIGCGVILNYLIIFIVKIVFRKFLFGYWDVI